MLEKSYKIRINHVRSRGEIPEVGSTTEIIYKTHFWTVETFRKNMQHQKMKNQFRNSAKTAKRLHDAPLPPDAGCRIAARGGRAVGRQGRGAVGRGARRRRPRRREGRITSQIMANLLLNFARTCGNVSQIWQTCQTIYQILHGSVSAVSKPIFQSKNE